MIVKDEEYLLRRCLDAAHDFVDEMVLVDTGSSDTTPQICREYTERCFEFELIDDFSAARNFSLQQARSEWILVLDADEVILPRHFRVLRETIAVADDDVFMLKQLNYSDDVTETDWQEVVGKHELGWDYQGFRVNPIARLFRNRTDIRYIHQVHEIIDPDLEGVRYGALNVPIHHDMDGDPTKPRADRSLKYLAMMEASLKQRPDGRLSAFAGAARMCELRDYRGAIPHFKRAVALGYLPERNKDSIAEAYYRMGEIDRAQAIYAELWASGYVTLSLCNNLSNLLVKKKDYARAVVLLERALLLDGLSADWRQRIRHNIAYLRSQLHKAGAAN